MLRSGSIYRDVLLAALCVATPAFLACTFGRSAGAGPNPREQPDELPILREHSGTYSRLRRPVRLVIRDARTLAQLPLAEVDVDFDREMVLVAGSGPMPGDKYAIRIRSIRRKGSMLAVETQTLRLEANETVSQRPSSPFHMVVVPRSDRKVAGFETRVDPDLFAGPGVRVPR